MTESGIELGSNNLSPLSILHAPCLGTTVNHEFPPYMQNFLQWFFQALTHLVHSYA